MSKSRDDYVAELKGRLDEWNLDLARWEAQARSVRDDLARHRKRELDMLHARREEALYQLKLLQGASAAAWSEIAAGADKAWQQLHAAIVAARGNFEKSDA